MPRISVITPAKIDDQTGLEWMGEMMESVQRQSYDDWEHVIVNDHSGVSLRPLAHHFRDERVRGLSAKHEKPSVARARNQAVATASGDLIFPLDADDRLPRNALSRFVKAWDAKSKDYGIIYSQVLMFDNDTSRLYTSMPYSFKALLRNTFMTVGCLHSKASWERIGGWNPVLDGGLEDWEYWIHAGLLGICGFLISEPLYEYRRHSSGRIARLRSNQNLWRSANQKIREMHRDAYAGRFPVGCCGNAATQLPAHKQHNKRQARQDILDQRAPIQNEVKMVYSGARGGSFGVRGITGRRYRVAGRGKEFPVDASDVEYLRKFNHGRDFKKA